MKVVVWVVTVGRKHGGEELWGVYDDQDAALDAAELVAGIDPEAPEGLHWETEADGSNWCVEGLTVYLVTPVVKDDPPKNYSEVRR